jgi:hypothetical protein
VDEIYKNLAELKKISLSNNVLTTAKEQITNGLISTNSDHSAIHRGFGYCKHLFFGELAFGAKKIYRITSPETLFMHIKSIQVGLIGATCAARLVKGTAENPLVITNTGTLESPSWNLNDNSPMTPQSKWYDGTVEYTGGQTWCEVVVRGFTTADTKQAPSNQTAGEFIQSDYLEYVTKNNNTEYILEVENIDHEENTAYDITIDMFYYEEPQGLIENGS